MNDFDRVLNFPAVEHGEERVHFKTMPCDQLLQGPVKIDHKAVVLFYI